MSTLTEGLKRIGTLDIDASDTKERIEWRFELFAWIVWTLILLLAALGLFGSGWLSSQSVGTNEIGLRLHYDRFVRHASRQVFEVSLLSLDPGAREAALTLNRELVETAKITHIDPPPLRVELLDGGYRYVFSTAPLTNPAPIIFHYEPDGYGFMNGSISRDEKEPLPLTQFVYP